MRRKNCIFKMILILLCLVIISSFYNVNAVEVDYQYTKEYLEWKELSVEDKKNTPQPQMISSNIRYKKKIDSWNDRNQMIGNPMTGKNVLATQSKFNLADYIDIEIKNQALTMECWAFGILSSMETNLLYKQGIKEQFSERHMDYATSNSFYDVNKEDLAYARDVSFGGLVNIGLAYLTNGQGAVYEEQMPFENSEDPISIEEIDIEPSYYVTDYVSIPSIYKMYNEDGSIQYYDAAFKEYSLDEVNMIRKEIKNHIVNYGALTSVTASAYLEGYNNQEHPEYATAFCCKDNTYFRDHAITIVGWDDTYSKENFSSESRPKSDGAYIVLQSYGDKAFDNGYMYISYEDNLIESLLYGVSDSRKYDYDKLYQNDYYGSAGTLSIAEQEVGYFASAFERDVSQKENLKQVSFNLGDYASVEVWVNPVDSNPTSNNVKKVSDFTSVLTPGYHTIEFDPIELTGDSFLVIIKQKSESGDFRFNVEFPCDDIITVNATSKPGRNKLSIDGKEWENLEDALGEGLDANADFCIKAFTDIAKIQEEPDTDKENEKEDEKEEVKDFPTNDEKDETEKENSKINSDIYKISSEYIKNIKVNTTVSEFLKNIEIESNKIAIYDNNQEIDLEKETILKTGMELVLEDKSYKLIVRGDISGDGEIKLLDVSKLVAHYAEVKGCKLGNVEECAGDMNLDNKISLIDVSQLVAIYADM